ncbi:hypothetical protein U0070_018880, partial [Myodes glareolus]
CREMLFLRRSWLWLYIRVGVFLGQELNNPQSNEIKICYRFYMLNCSFNEAQAYCETQRGHLTWNQGLQTFIQNFTKMERTWWVGRSLPPPRKHQEATHTDGFPQPPEGPGNNENNSRKPKKKRGAQKQTNVASGDAYLSTTCRQQRASPDHEHYVCSSQTC